MTLRKGSELDANAKALERHLCQKAHESGRTVSTLDRLENDQAQALADSYARRYALCLTHPLRVFGETFGMLTLHYDGLARPPSTRSSMRSGRSRTMPRSRSTTPTPRQDLRDFAYTDPLTGLASRRQLHLELGVLA